MNRTNYLRDVFFYHQSNALNAGLWADRSMAWQRTVTHNNDDISDNYDNDDDDDGHSHREQHPHTAPDLPPVTWSCQSRYPLREIGDLGLCLSTSNPTQITVECAYQFIDTLLSGLASKYWDTFSTFSSRIQYHLSDIPYTIYAVLI